MYIGATAGETDIVITAWQKAGLILGLRSVNERRRYKVTPSPIGWTQT